MFAVSNCASEINEVKSTLNQLLFYQMTGLVCLWFHEIFLFIWMKNWKACYGSPCWLIGLFSGGQKSVVSAVEGYRSIVFSFHSISFETCICRWWKKGSLFVLQDII